jgi:RNA polymerase sigma-70 factor (ECF subfamily)
LFIVYYPFFIIDISIIQLKNGDHGAYEAVFKSWYEPLCVYACSLLHDMDAAEDMVQKMFCTLWDKRDKLDVHTSLNAYLYKAVHNVCLNHIKHGKVRTAYQTEWVHLNDEGDDDTDNRLLHNELEQELSRAVEQLPAQCRKVFEMSRVEQLSYNEIAEQLQISHNTVENHISKALKLLREHLKDFLIYIIILII